MAFWDDWFGGGKSKSVETQTNWQPAPEYPEAEGARASWWDTLQKWGSQPGFGAIQPDWTSIWENAKSKVQRYFQGGPEGPGLNAQVASNTAKRGMSDQPAADVMLQRSGFQEGNMLQDLAVQQAINEAQLGEQGRTNWMNSLMSLSQQKPDMLNYGTIADSYGPSTGSQVGKATGSVVGSNKGGIMQMFQPIMDMFGLGGTSGDTGIGDVSGINSGDQQEEDMWSDPQTYAQMAKLAMLFI